MEERNWEEEARAQGWKPEEEYEGDKPWTDAQTFVEKGEQIAGILKSRLDRQEQEISRLKQSNKEFGEYQKSLRERERAKSQQRISELEAQIAQAVNDSDGQAYTQLSRELNQERDSLNAPQESNGGGELDPVAQAWLMNNEWYNTNNRLQTYADGLADRLIQQGYTAGSPAYFTELTRQVKETFPEEFSNRRKEGANAVETGGQQEVNTPEARTYENLPPDAKAACDRWERDGLMTKEEYVATYEWE